MFFVWKMFFSKGLLVVGCFGRFVYIIYFEALIFLLYVVGFVWGLYLLSLNYVFGLWFIYLFIYVFFIFFLFVFFLSPLFGEGFRTRHAGHCWRSRDELISDVLLRSPTYGRAKAGRPARTYIQQLCEDTGCSPEDLPEAMNNREKWRERVRDIRASDTTWWWWWWCVVLFRIFLGFSSSF